ncbi:unnamed protein product [Arctogadus glacialis]
MRAGVHSAVMSQHVNRAEPAVFSSRASVVAVFKFPSTPMVLQKTPPSTRGTDPPSMGFFNLSVKYHNAAYWFRQKGDCGALNPDTNMRAL